MPLQRTLDELNASLKELPGLVDEVKKIRNRFRLQNLIMVLMFVGGVVLSAVVIDNRHRANDLQEVVARQAQQDVTQCMSANERSRLAAEAITIPITAHRLILMLSGGRERSPQAAVFDDYLQASTAWLNEAFDPRDCDPNSPTFGQDVDPPGPAPALPSNIPPPPSD